jgi:hypothetical protein
MMMTTMTTLQESLWDGLTKQTFTSLIDNATIGTNLLKIFDLLPNCSQRYGHSLTMNALIKIIIRHPLFHDRASIFNTIKIKKGEETTVPCHWVIVSHLPIRQPVQRKQICVGWRQNSRCITGKNLSYMFTVRTF